MDLLQNDPLLKNVPGIQGYKVLRPAVLYAKIGQGGMGAVYRGRHLNLEVDVAVKCLKASLAEEGTQFITRFQREAKIAAGIHHENLVHVYDVSSEAGVHYLVMEYISGETVRERVRRKGALKEREAATILLGAARGLAVAHKKRIVHRDIKPDNIMISRDGAVKVADLGIARAAGEEYATMTVGSLGTPQYMPPEQWLDASKVAATADIWALGATLYFMLVGENAIQANTQGECALRICNHDFPDITTPRPDLDPRLRTILRRMTERDPARRHQSGAEIARELEQWLGETHVDLADDGAGGSKVQTLVSPPPAQTLAQIRIEVGTRAGTGVAESTPTESVMPPRTTPPSPVRNLRGWYAGAGILGVLLVGGGVWKFVLAEPAEEEPPPNPEPNLRPLVDPGKPPDQPTRPDIVPSIHLTETRLLEALAKNRSVVTRDLSYELIGNVESRSGEASLTVVVAGKSPLHVPIEEDGSFKARLQLSQENGRNLIKLAHADAQTIEFTIEHDSIPPDLEVSSPKPSERTTQASSIDVLVDADDRNLDSVRISTVPTKKDAEGRWKAAGVPLSEGANTLPLVARDTAGNESKRDLTVERDTRAPEILPWNADEQELVPNTTANVRVRFDEPVETVVFGKEVLHPRTDSQVISVKVPDKPGPFSVELELEDKLTNKALRSFDLVAGPKRLVPVIQLDGQVPASKEPIFWKTSSYRLKGRIENASGGAIEVAIDGGEPADYTLGSDGSFERNLGLNANELNKIRISYPDASPLLLSVIQDSIDPVVELIEPVDLRTREASVDILVELEEENPGSLELEGSPLQHVKGKRWKAAQVALRDGKNAFSIVARDAAGRTSSLPIAISCDTVVPSLKAVDPPERSVLAPGSQFRMRLQFSETVEALEINGERSKPGEAEFEKELTVPGGQGTFSVVVEMTDGVGNSSSRTLTYARTPPPETSEPTKPPVLGRILPTGWIVEDPTLGDGGWPKKARDSRSDIVFLLVPRGIFKQGLEPRVEGKGLNKEETKDELPQHRASIDAPFYLGETEVTIGQWRTFAEASGYKTEAERSGCGRVLDLETFKWKEDASAIWSIPRPDFRGNPDPRPVTQVSWVDAQAFCEHFSLALPTESQWEYACRAGTEWRYWWGPREGDGAGKANLLDKSIREHVDRDTLGFDDQSPFTAKVDSFLANPWGFRGMLGNVAEWCQDPYDADLYRERASDPSAQASPSEERVLRGGSWASDGTQARSATRFHTTKSGKVSDTYGFRASWTPPQ